MDTTNTDETSVAEARERNYIAVRTRLDYPKRGGHNAYLEAVEALDWLAAALLAAQQERDVAVHVATNAQDGRDAAEATVKEISEYVEGEIGEIPEGIRDIIKKSGKSTS